MTTAFVKFCHGVRPAGQMTAIADLAAATRLSEFGLLMLCDSLPVFRCSPAVVICSGVARLAHTLPSWTQMIPGTRREQLHSSPRPPEIVMEDKQEGSATSESRAFGCVRPLRQGRSPSLPTRPFRSSDRPAARALDQAADKPHYQLLGAQHPSLSAASVERGAIDYLCSDDRHDAHGKYAVFPATIRIAV